MTTSKAKFKPLSEMPAVEDCCEAQRQSHKSQEDEEFLVDLENVGGGYGLHARGHCGQPLPYDRWVMVVDTKGNPLGKVPFALIDIDEGI